MHIEIFWPMSACTDCSGWHRVNILNFNEKVFWKKILKENQDFRLLPHYPTKDKFSVLRNIHLSSAKDFNFNKGKNFVVW